MSAGKRRAARKIAMLVRMDATRARMRYNSLLALFGRDPAMIYWATCMTPLGKALTRLGLADRARVKLEDARALRVAAGGRP